MSRRYLAIRKFIHVKLSDVEILPGEKIVLTYFYREKYCRAREKYLQNEFFASLNKRTMNILHDNIPSSKISTKTTFPREENFAWWELHMEKIFYMAMFLLGKYPWDEDSIRFNFLVALFLYVNIFGRWHIHWNKFLSGKISPWQNSSKIKLPLGKISSKLNFRAANFQISDWQNLRISVFLKTTFRIVRHNFRKKNLPTSKVST